MTPVIVEGIVWACAPIFLLGCYTVICWIADGFALLDQWYRARGGR